MSIQRVRPVVVFTIVLMTLGLMGCAGTYGPDVDQTQLEYAHREASTVLEMARQYDLTSDKRFSRAEELFNETFKKHKTKPRNDLSDQYRKVSRLVQETIGTSINELRDENTSLRETVRERKKKISELQDNLSYSSARIENLGETIARLKEDRDRFWEIAHSRGDTIHSLERTIHDLRENQRINDSAYADTITRLRTQRDQYLRRTRSLGDTIQHLRQKLSATSEGGDHDSLNIKKIPIDIQFDRRSARLKPSFQQNIDEVVDRIRGDDTGLIIVVGHTDSHPLRTGDQVKSNWNLSFQRALNVLEYLVYVKDVSKTRVLPVGAAELYPVATNETEEGRQRNRRVEIYTGFPGGFLDS